MFRINYFVYKPVKQDYETRRMVNNSSSARKRYISLMNSNSSQSDQDCDSKDIDQISRIVI